jgi:hypothetical protein
MHMQYNALSAVNEAGRYGNCDMAWEVEFTDEFGTWWGELTENEQDAIDRTIGLLEERGPTLGYPYSSDVKGSRHGRMRELRVQQAGHPIRIFYAWDPRRVCLLLIGGDKSGDNQFYERMVTIADDLYTEHLEILLREDEHDKGSGDG